MISDNVEFLPPVFMPCFGSHFEKPPPPLNPQTYGFDPLYHKSENFRIHWKHISITLPSFMKFCPVVLEICRGQVHASRKERIRIIIIKIQIIIRNGAKAISLPNIIWET